MIKETSWWYRTFLIDKPSIGLSLFRMAVALTVGFHVIPSFFNLSDTYLSTALKEYNSSFFTLEVLRLVQLSGDSFVKLMVFVFLSAWFLFLVGFLTQLSGIVLTLGCYYFYALNSFHIGTLSWDILLVTLVLMVVTPYPGDCFSIDALRRGQEPNFQRQRPYFVQRLLQLQIASTYFFTGLYKVTAEGNWFKENPLFILMHYPPGGVTKYFLIRDWMAQHEAVCYWIGVTVVAIELLMPFLLFYRRTRLGAIILGFIFHVTLILTLDVPTIFFFLFPAQLLLFIDPVDIVKWIEERRAINAASPMRILYDGQCGFCLGAVRLLLSMDLFKKLSAVNIHDVDGESVYPGISKTQAFSQMHVIDRHGKIKGGFEAFRRLCWLLPALYPLILVVYLPGMGIIGRFIYQLVARNRFLLHHSLLCKDNSCRR